MCYLYLFTHTGVQNDFHFRWCSCHLTVTRWMCLVEQELLTIPGHPSSRTGFSVERVVRSLISYMCNLVDHCLFFCPLFTIFCMTFFHLKVALNTKNQLIFHLRLLTTPLVSRTFFFFFDYMSTMAGVLLEAGIVNTCWASVLTLGFCGGVRVAHLFSFLSCAFLFCLSSFCVVCDQCFQCHWIVHSWWSLRFSLIFI